MVELLQTIEHSEQGGEGFQSQIERGHSRVHQILEGEHFREPER